MSPISDISQPLAKLVSQMLRTRFYPERQRDRLRLFPLHDYLFVIEWAWYLSCMAAGNAVHEEGVRVAYDQMNSKVATSTRRLPIGAELVGKDQVHFRVWAPEAKVVAVVLDDGTSEKLTRSDDGYFSGFARARAGTRYEYRLDQGEPRPDPASRFQPQGPHGPSEIVDPSTFAWTDSDWNGVDIKTAVVYEMHIGTFTPKGTWAAAAAELDSLAQVGITILEVMPVADFPGRFGWGYDGVNMFAPTRLYGTPDDFRAFVNRAHALGMGVILDVVYNHFGPDGNYLREFSKSYFSTRYKNEWGEAINFDAEQSEPVREFFLANAGYWIDEFHLDGLRLDATQQIFDSSKQNIVQLIGRRVREAAKGRKTFIVAENEPQESRIVRSETEGGYGLDALWNDDFHHSAKVALTGKNQAYYSDYRGTPQELMSAVKWGFLYQGQRYSWQKKPRGMPSLDLPPSRFVVFLQNHDQVANSGRGLPVNLLTSPGRYRAMTALLLLAPGIPMLFQGQEYGSTRPFLYFAEHKPDLAKLVAKGRGEFLAQFPDLALPATQAQMLDPADPNTFQQCKLNASERRQNASTFGLHRDLLSIRRTDETFSQAGTIRVDGAVLSDQAFVLRYFGRNGADRLVVVNLGKDLRLTFLPEPLIAPPVECEWKLFWSSDDLDYGGCGSPPPITADDWFFPGETTLVLAPVPRESTQNPETFSI